MWISIRNSGGQRSEQVLVLYGPQRWGRPLVSVARFVQRRRWEREVQEGTTSFWNIVNQLNKQEKVQNKIGHGR